MIHDLIYNERSLRSIGFLLRDAEYFVTAERDVEYEDIAGATGAALLDNGGYKNIELSYAVNSFPYWLEHKTEQQIANDLIDWFRNYGDYKILRDTSNPGYFYYAIPKAPEKIEKLSEKLLTTTLTFSCKPFKYLESGLDKLVFNGPSATVTATLFNPEQYESEPYIKVSTNGPLRLVVNGIVLDISACQGYIEIDTETKHVYKGTVSQDYVVTGNYLPTFKAGENIVRATGTSNNSIYSLEVIPRWRRL